MGNCIIRENCQEIQLTTQSQEKSPQQQSINDIYLQYREKNNMNYFINSYPQITAYHSIYKSQIKLLLEDLNAKNFHSLNDQQKLHLIQKNQMESDFQ